MNAKAAKACRAWLSATGLSHGAQRATYRHAKASYRALSHRERGALRSQWEEARAVRRLRAALKSKAASAIVKPEDLKL